MLASSMQFGGEERLSHWKFLMSDSTSSIAQAIDSQPQQTTTFGGQKPSHGNVPLRKRRWFWPAVVGVAAFTFGAVVGAGGGSSPTPSEVKGSSEYKALAADLEHAKSDLASAKTAADAAKQAADDAKQAQDKAEAKVADLEAAASAPPAAPSPTPAAATFTMPSVVGMNLQLAQDTLQALGSYVMDQQDASGLGRVQIIDSNWKVCTQNPAPGAVVPTETLVALASVKLTESCP